MCVCVYVCLCVFVFVSVCFDVVSRPANNNNNSVQFAQNVIVASCQSALHVASWTLHVA